MWFTVSKKYSVGFLRTIFFKNKIVNSFSLLQGNYQKSIHLEYKGRSCGMDQALVLMDTVINH